MQLIFLDCYLIFLLDLTFFGQVILNKCFVIYIFAKLNPTQLQLVGLGVDFVSLRKKKEGRRINPHLPFSRRNDPTCLIFGDCLVGVWRVSGGCLPGVWQVSFGCLEGVLRVS